MHLAEYSEATTLLEEAVSGSSEPGEAHLKATALSYLGRLALAWGEHEQAREPLDRALELLREASPRALILPLVARAHLARCEGERDLARHLLEEAVNIARAGGEGPARALLGMGDLAADEGDFVAAQRLYEEALAHARADVASDQAAQALDGLARLARAEGAAQQATRLQSEALQLRHESGRARGLVESLEVTPRLGLATDPVLHAARLFDAAGALREASGFESSPREVAADKADPALLGRSFWAEELEAASQASALRPDRPPAEESNGTSGEGCDMPDWASLTEREREVAALVAEGMTNEGIADRLVITPATVKTHLAHIFRKLGISKRSELAEEVWRRRRESFLGEGGPPAPPRNGR